MSSVSISILESKKEDYQSKLESARKSLRSNESEYESLSEFKGKVQISQGSLYAITARVSSLVLSTYQYRDTNGCVKNFIETITNFLRKIGTRIVNVAYSALIEMISSLLKSTYKKIEELNDDIIRYSDDIEDLDKEIAYQQSLEV